MSWILCFVTVGVMYLLICSLSLTSLLILLKFFIIKLEVLAKAKALLLKENKKLHLPDWRKFYWWEVELSAASDSKTTFITNHPIAYVGIVALGWMQWTGCCDPKRDYISYTLKTPLRYTEKDYLLLYSLHWKIFSCYERNIFLLLVLYLKKKNYFSLKDCWPLANSEF